MNVAHIFASAVVRRLAYVLAALLLAWVGIGKASAQTVDPNCTVYTAGTTTAVCDDQGQAVKHVQAFIDWRMTQAPYNDASYGYYEGPVLTVACDATYCGYTQYIMRNGVNQTNATRKYPKAKTCATRADLDSGYMRRVTAGGAPKACKDGCQFKMPDDGAFVDIALPDGSGWLQSADRYTPDGTICTGPNDVPKNTDDCIPVDGQSVCKNTDGKLCYTASTGRRICWATGEVGTKTDGNIAQTRALGTAPIPPNLGQPTTPAPTPPITTTTTTNTTTTNHTTNNYTTTSGAPAGSSNDGEGTNPDGTGTGTGTGGTGTGGTGTGTGTDMTETNGLLGTIKDKITGVADFFDGLTTEADGLDQSPGDDVPASDAWEGGDGEGDPPTLNDAGYGYGNACPSPPQINIPGGGQLDWSALCTWAGYFGTLILAAAYVQAAFVIGRA